MWWVTSRLVGRLPSGNRGEACTNKVPSQQRNGEGGLPQGVVLPYRAQEGGDPTMGLFWFRLLSRLVIGVIQWPQSGIQRQQTDVDTDIETEATSAMADVDAEYEALVAEYSVALV